MRKEFSDIPLEFNFVCPACGTSTNLPADHSEDTFTCPHCQKLLPVPEHVKELLGPGKDLQDHIQGILGSD